MSTKFPFTSAGLNDLLETLYVLPDESLQAEAEELLFHFRAWVIAHFELSGKQVQDLDNLQHQTVHFMAVNTSFAVGNRLVIRLEKEERLGAKGDPEYKVIETVNNLKVTDGSPQVASRSGAAGFVPGGEVIIRISYL